MPSKQRFSRNRQPRRGSSTALPESAGRIELRGVWEEIARANAGRPGIGEIYEREVLPVPTRTIHLLGRKCPAQIIHTLLGYEVQASYKRVHCPDLVTARYLRIFTEIGCRSIKLPLDPTVTERLVGGLEEAGIALQRGAERRFPENRRLQVYLLRRLCSSLRSRLSSH